MITTWINWFTPEEHQPKEGALVLVRTTTPEIEANENLVLARFKMGKFTVQDDEDPEKDIEILVHDWTDLQ